MDETGICQIEIHVGTAPMTAATRKAIKRAGGTYSKCRGYSQRRFLTFPPDVDASVVDPIIEQYGVPKFTRKACGTDAAWPRYAFAVIFRYGYAIRPVVVSYARSLTEARSRLTTYARATEARAQAVIPTTVVR